MSKRKPPTKSTPRNYQTYFTLCQIIGGELEEAGHRIAGDGIHAPAMHSRIIADLEYIKRFCDRAIEAVNKAQQVWNSMEPTHEA